MLINNKFGAQIVTENPTGNPRCHALASRALNMSCNFGQSARSTESRCVVRMWTNISSSTYMQNVTLYPFGLPIELHAGDSFARGRSVNSQAPAFYRGRWLTCLNLTTQPPRNANFRLALMHFICHSSAFVHGLVNRIQSRCIITDKHIFPTCKFVLIKPKKLHSRRSARAMLPRDSNELTHRQGMLTT